ncbi:MAG: CapA family protein [Muribaculaceae bacterium]|nr:CapA family protein [Muribaculaceae bacterium]MDE6332946.1 CapA family protein [Muribaculaceae bacterium]
MNTALLSIILNIAALLGQSSDVELLFAGDAMQHKAQIDAARRSDGTYDYSDCFTDVEAIVKGADFAIVNLETPVGSAGPYSGYPCFYAPASFVDALADAGFDLFLTANNHTLDRRARGLRSTVDELNARCIYHTGTYKNAAERASSLPLVLPVKGMRIAFLNYTYGTNGIQPNDGVVVDYIDRDLITDDIARARVAGAEAIVVAVHWGDEYRLLPNQSQKSLAKFLVEQGADLIIGSHPHVIQPMEVVHSDTFDKNVLVVYSLGNFISNMKTRDTRGGAFVRARLRRTPDGKVRFADADWQLHFTVPAGNGRNYHVVPADSVSIPQWQRQAADFSRAATDIFHRHNRNVPQHNSQK